MIVGGMRRHALWIISLVAIVHGAFYVAYLKPEWDTAWSDREGYVRLGEALAESGRFTRYPDAPVFAPEVIRTPGYPAFVAVFYRLFGVRNDVAVAAAQVAIYPLLCLLVYAITRRIASDRAAVAAAAMTALFSPIAHFAGLILTEFWTTVVLTAALYYCLRALQQQRLHQFVIAGALQRDHAGAAGVRAAPVLPGDRRAAARGLAADRAGARPLAGAGDRRRADARAMVHLQLRVSRQVHALAGRWHRPRHGKARGRQGRWPGRVQAELTDAATVAPTQPHSMLTSPRSRATGFDAALMREYVHEWRDIHAVWDTPTDPTERARARVAADQLYLDAAVRHIGEDPIGHVTRRVTRGTFQLWAADVPIRFSQINQTPTIVIRLIWLVQVLLLLAAGVGAVRSDPRGTGPKPCCSRCR